MAKNDNKANIFDRLSNLFSSNVIIKSVGKENRLKLLDANGIRSFANVPNNFLLNNTGLGIGYATNSRYNSEWNGYSPIRKMLYRDYELMCSDPIIHAALNIYADEITSKDEFGDVLTIKTDNKQIKELLTNLFYDIMNINFNLWPWSWSLCKYGDLFLKLDLVDKYGIVNVNPISIYELDRVERFDPKNPYRVKYSYQGMENPYNKNIKGKVEENEYEEYEICHFRLLSDTNSMPYGRSVLEGARRDWKKLTLLEDAMLIHRIMRAPEKRVYKLDVGNLPPNEIDQYIRSFIANIKKIPYINPTTGDYNLKFNMQNITEDIFVPVRGGKNSTDIQSLPGLEYNAIDDIEYIKEKILAGLMIPKAFLNFSENVEGKSTLAAMEVRFAKTIERLQRLIVSELSKAAVIHLYMQGIPENELLNFELKLTNASTIAEQEKISLWSEKISLAKDMLDSKMFSTNFVYNEIFNLDEDRINILQKEVLEDIKKLFRYAQIESEGNDPLKTGQTFGTPHDLLVLQKGYLKSKANDPEKEDALDLSNSNIDKKSVLYPLKADQEKDGNLTDNPEYDANYNAEKRKDPPTTFNQDSHPRGRDVSGMSGYSTAHIPRRNSTKFEYLNRIPKKDTSVILESLLPDTESQFDESNVSFLNENSDEYQNI